MNKLVEIPTTLIAISAPANECSGCWFANKKIKNIPLCWAQAVNTQVKNVFKTTGGSCKGLIAVSADEANAKKTA